jgi:Amt family ammonium transporter
MDGHELTLVLVVIVDKTVGFKLGEADELAGMDHALHREHGYGLLNLN